MATNNVDSGGGGSSSEEPGQPGCRAIPEEVLDFIRAVVSELLDQQRQLASTGSGSSNATGTAPDVPTPSGLPPLDTVAAAGNLGESSSTRAGVAETPNGMCSL